ncbi:MAG: luciferase, partial [archaeon]|nr:luciferase [archaeon]
IVPSQAWNRELLDLIIGSHDPKLQKEVNEILPVKVFNLSITPSELIEKTHERMKTDYNSRGGSWQRNYMPRTIMVFLNDEPNLSDSERKSQAKIEAEKALNSYWGALEGTIDPAKVSKAAENSVVGNVEDVAQQIVERFDSKDCIMTWFDFFNHDSPRVVRNMEAFMNKVVPRVRELVK